MSKRSHWGLLLSLLAICSVLALPATNLSDTGPSEMDVAVSAGHAALLRSTLVSPHAQASAIAEQYLVSVSAKKRVAPELQPQARAPRRASYQQLLCTFLI